jgi:hypothetical protein
MTKRNKQGKWNEKSWKAQSENKMGLMLVMIKTVLLTIRWMVVGNVGCKGKMKHLERNFEKQRRK